MSKAIFVIPFISVIINCLYKKHNSHWIKKLNCKVIPPVNLLLPVGNMDINENHDNDLFFKVITPKNVIIRKLEF